MSAYSSYTYLNGGTSLSDQAWSSIKENTGEFGATLSEYSTKMDTAFTEMKNTVYDNTIGKVGQLFGSETDVLMEGPVLEYNDQIGATIDGAKTNATENSWWKTDIISKEAMQQYIPGAQAITNGSLASFGISAGMQILAPTEAEYRLAEKLLNPLANSADVSVQAYNSCLTSIGLSFPAVVGYSFDEEDAMSKQLKEPLKHPIRLTTTQLEAIYQVMGIEYLKRAYIYTSSDNFNLNVYASNAEAYVKAGQVVCAGHKVAQTMDYINIKTQAPLPTQGTSGTSVAVNIAISAIAMINPVIGFALKIVMDLYTNMFTKIDTCNKEKDAIAKMNQFYNLQSSKY
jgi:hypothetical protein